MTDNWIKRFPYRTFTGEPGAYNAREYLTILSARDQNRPTHYWDRTGACTVSLEELEQFIETKLGAMLVQTQYDNALQPHEMVYLMPDGSIDIDWMESAKEVNVSLATRSQTTFDTATKWLSEVITIEPPRGAVYALMARGNSIQIELLDVAGEELSRTNYADEALTKFDHVITEWNSDKPSGRLVLLDGPPGTGKTYAVRGFLNEVQDTTAVLVPPGQFETLTNPSLLPVLVDFVSDLRERRLLFVIEDADAAIMTRGVDNLDVLSVLLNLADGIVGAALNIRILCTTNSRVEDLDDAVKRPGRLLEHIHLGALSLDKAKEVLASLDPDATLPPKTVKGGMGFDSSSQGATYTLAEIYKAVRVRRSEEES